MKSHAKPRRGRQIAELPEWMQSMEWTCEYCGKTRQVKDFLTGSAHKCGKCASRESAEWQRQNGTRLPMEEAKDSAIYLGVYIAERALSKFFDNITRMPYGNPGFDFICGRGYKIDAKSSCLHYPRAKGVWTFSIKRNKVADYFLLLAFDDRENLTPLHVWLVPGEKINNLSQIEIRDTAKGRARLAQYERPLDRVVACCSEMRSEAMP